VPRPDSAQGWHWADVLLAAAALRTGLLEAVGERGDPEAAAASLGLEARAARIVCGALADAGHVTEDAGRWSLTERGRHLLAPAGGGVDVAGDVLSAERSILAHTRLADVLAGAGKVDDVSGGDREGRRRFMRAMRRSAEALAPAAAEAVGPPAGGRRLLDVGGAPGVHARAFAAAGWQVTVLDLPETVEVARDDLEAGGAAVVAGDMTEGLPAGPWDCVFLGNVAHLLGPDAAAALLARAGAALEPGGVLAVEDLVLGRSPMGRRFALVMLLTTDAGEVYDEAAYRLWMEAAGCPLERVADLAGGLHQVMLGRRRASAAGPA